VHRYFSPPADPGSRGVDFGRAHADRIDGVLRRYQELFDAVAGGPVDLDALGDASLDAVTAFSQAAAEEIRGIAEGAGQSVQDVAALNARTEVLAAVGGSSHGECSAVISLGANGEPPVSVQTWDWHDHLADDWFLWTIEHPDGHRTYTLTEFGILGKIGVNTRGIGTHFNILHHVSDGAGIGTPMHVIARCVLDRASDVGEALSLVASAEVSASSVLSIIGSRDGASTAICAELSPPGPRFVLPSADGLLIHTNHFLDVHSAAGDLEPRKGPDTYLRYDVLQRALSGRGHLSRDDIVAAMTSHLGLGGAVCCHAQAGAELGDRWATLATISLDVDAGTFHAREGGPCSSDSPWTQPLMTAPN
jgi:isopenicillin-N N-acyltransferase-like protein